MTSICWPCHLLHRNYPPNMISVSIFLLILMLVYKKHILIGNGIYCFVQNETKVMGSGAFGEYTNWKGNKSGFEIVVHLLNTAFHKKS